MTKTTMSRGGSYVSCFPARIMGQFIERRAKLLLQNHGLSRAEILDTSVNPEDAIAGSAQSVGP